MIKLLDGETGRFLAFEEADALFLPRQVRFPSEDRSLSERDFVVEKFLVGRLPRDRRDESVYTSEYAARQSIRSYIRDMQRGNYDSGMHLAELHKLADDVIGSMRTAGLVDTANRLLLEYAADPSRQNQAEMSDWGINTFREDARKMQAQYGKDYYGRQVAVAEANLINRARLRGDPEGLVRYMRLSREGSEWPFTRKMRVGLFVHLVAIGAVRG